MINILHLSRANLLDLLQILLPTNPSHSLSHSSPTHSYSSPTHKPHPFKLCLSSNRNLESLLFLLSNRYFLFRTVILAIKLYV